MQGRGQTTGPDRDAARRPTADLVTLGAVPAGVTSAVFVPQLVTDPADFPAALNLVWLALVLTAAPVVAAVLAWRSRAALAGARPWLLGLPQLFVCLALVRLDTWLEVRRGYLLAGSGEEAMSYGIGSIVGAGLGLVLTGLVALGVHLGSRKRTVRDLRR